MSTVEIGGDSAVKVDARRAGDRRPQLFCLLGCWNPRRLTAFDADAFPPANVDQPSEAGRLEQPHGARIACCEAHLPETLLASLGDRRSEHGLRQALPPMGAGDPQALVPDEPWRVGSQSLQPDHDAVQLDSLEGSASLRNPVIKYTLDVVMAVPHIADHLEHTITICWSNGSDRQRIDGRQCAIPESERPPS